MEEENKRIGTNGMVDQENFRLIQALDIQVVKYALRFKRPAKTSRDVLLDRDVYYIILHDKVVNKQGIGECAPIWGLSPETKSDTEQSLKKISSKTLSRLEFEHVLLRHSSIRFALETALADLAGGGKLSPFSDIAINGIPINGLVWMNDAEPMLAEALEKINQGFHCIKLKIGGLNFEDELNILRKIRQQLQPNEISIRLDANGAFRSEEALQKIKTLSEFHIHSIEQPIKPRQEDDLALICKNTSIPIALDEELIGIHAVDQKKKLLSSIQPQFIVLKPTLHGGFTGCDEWITLAEQLGIGWWVTSALESNIGLNAIARWISSKNNALEQGLGTGSLYQQNIPSPLLISKGRLMQDPDARWDLQLLSQMPILI